MQLGPNGRQRLVATARHMEMTLALPVQALLAEIAMAAFQHRHQQVALLFFVESGDAGHGRSVAKISPQSIPDCNAFLGALRRRNAVFP